ncbi:N-glycosylase DNA lyase-like [Paramuricea clavata]|uniref:N-glycosylase/DNA lyase n=1 Tax=Paramuricea clavata TaxID=317549 RepID=A0A6S7FEV1_PARCT|nr:N-glycosylase DNA lyase-like [Paramuricea clavata]
MASVWKRLSCDGDVLNLGITLVCGQAFRWKKLNNEEWCGVLSGKVWTFKQSSDGIYYKVNSRLSEVESTTQNESILNDYFQLNIDLHHLYDHWSSRDDNFKQVAATISGFRLLRQDPVENLFSFICSSNNNIERISSMVEALCVKYGGIITEVNGVVYHDFPSIATLAEPQVEQELRELKFGYRAKFIHETAKILMKKCNKDWLISLREVPYEEAHAALCELPGVGAKVADCVCLMSLDKTDAIPVDTHVWQISCRDYNIPDLKKSKSLTNKAYKAIGDHFRQLFGKYAGWANSVLFSGDLKKFQDSKVNYIQVSLI